MNDKVVVSGNCSLCYFGLLVPSYLPRTWNCYRIRASTCRVALWEGDACHCSQGHDLQFMCLEKTNKQTNYDGYKTFFTTDPDS